jgi:hypothetical protein
LELENFQNAIYFYNKTKLSKRNYSVHFYTASAIEWVSRNCTKELCFQEAIVPLVTHQFATRRKLLQLSEQRSLLTLLSIVVRRAVIICPLRLWRVWE